MRNPTKYCNVNLKNKRHLFFISLLYRVNYVTKFRGKKIADIDALNYWLETRTIYKKPLILLKRKELIVAMRKFESEVVKKKYVDELKSLLPLAN